MSFWSIPDNKCFKGREEPKDAESQELGGAGKARTRERKRTQRGEEEEGEGKGRAGRAQEDRRRV